MVRVLLGFAEALAAPEAIFSLRAAGHEVRLFAREGPLPPAARHLAGGAGVLAIPAPETDADGAVAALRRAHDAAVILPADDTALWLADAAFGTAGLPVAGATGTAAALALDKAAQIEAARAAGFAVPPTAIVTSPGTANKALEMPGAIPCPAIVKPARAVAHDGAGLVKGKAWYLSTPADTAGLPADPDDPLYPALMQPLLGGTGIGLFGFAGAAGISAWSGHERLRMMNPHGSGASACRSRAPDRAERIAAERMLTAIGWRGPFMIELLRGADGTAWFIELNGRLWGSMALARRAGLEYPAWAVAQALDPGFSPPVTIPPPQPLEIRHLGREILHLMFVLRGPKTDFHKAAWPRFGTSLRAVLRPGPASGFYNYDPDYRWFFLRDAWATITGALRR